MEAKTTIAAAVASVAAFSSAATAATYDVVTDGSVTIEITADLASVGLGMGFSLNADGNPETTASARPTGLDDQNRPTGTGSEVLPGGEANLSLRSRGFYLYAIDTNGDQVESFDSVKVFPFRGTLDPSVTDEMRDINYVPVLDTNGDPVPGEYTNYETGDPITLTAAQEAGLQDGEIRTCCAHTLGSLTLNTADLTMDGIIDGQTFRDFNNDGINDNDTFYLFDLIPTGDAGIFDLALTAELAQYVNFGFTPPAFADSSAFIANWANFQNGTGLLDFQGGDVIGTITYDYTIGSVTGVPLPAGLPLLAAGMGVLGFVRSRRNKSKAA